MGVLRHRPAAAPRGGQVARALAIALVALAAGLVALGANAGGGADRWADPSKTLRVTFPVAETGFDPQASQDYYSSHVERAIFEPLYGYAYLDRPYRREPVTAQSMPEISADGRTWTIKVKPGIYFTDDAAFKGKRRELTAEDYVYSWKRLLDPRMRSLFTWYLDGKLVGADEVVAKAKADNRFDYDAPIEGLKALDRYTIRLVLKEPDYILLGYMSTVTMAAVAREVVEAYGDASGWVMANPVGTGPYRLKEWRRGQKIVLEANAGYREVRFPLAAANADPETRAIAAAMRGKRMPQIGRIEISIIEESNPQLLAFERGELDYVNVPADLVDNVLDAGRTLRRKFVEQGITLHRAVQPSLAYCYFNMDDPIVGGYTADRVALRRAIVMGLDTDALIKVWYQGQAMRATQPIPPDVAGHANGIDTNVRHDAATARKLLDRFGYVDRDGDGWREMPDGKPIVLSMGSTTTGRDRERDELWQRSMKDIGLRIEFVKQKWPELLKMGRAGKLQMWPVGWITTYGEGDAFMQLLYGPNVGQSNFARFKLDAYDALYRQSKRLPDGPQRTALYAKMAELIAAYTPWDLGVYRIENTLVRPSVLGYRKHIYFEHAWQYLDIDAGKKEGVRG